MHMWHKNEVWERMTNVHVGQRIEWNFAEYLSVGAKKGPENLARCNAKRFAADAFEIFGLGSADPCEYVCSGINVFAL